MIDLTETQKNYAETLLDTENTVYFKFHAGPSQTDYVTIEIARIRAFTDGQQPRAVCDNMTYHLAKNFGLGLGRRNTAREFQIPQGGGGYSKTHHVAYSLAMSIGFDTTGAAIPKNWRY